MADPIHVVPGAQGPSATGPSASDEWERLLAALHRHGVLSAAADLAEQSDQVAAVLLQRLEAPEAERRLRSLLALLMPATDTTMKAQDGPKGGLSGLLKLWRILRERPVQEGLHRLLQVVRRLGQTEG